MTKATRTSATIDPVSILSDVLGEIHESRDLDQCQRAYALKVIAEGAVTSLDAPPLAKYLLRVWKIVADAQGNPKPLRYNLQLAAADILFRTRPGQYTKQYKLNDYVDSAIKVARDLQWLEEHKHHTSGNPVCPTINGWKIIEEVMTQERRPNEASSQTPAKTNSTSFLAWLETKGDVVVFCVNGEKPVRMVSPKTKKSIKGADLLRVLAERESWLKPVPISELEEDFGPPQKIAKLIKRLRSCASNKMADEWFPAATTTGAIGFRKAVGCGPPASKDTLDKLDKLDKNDKKSRASRKFNN